MIWDSRELKLFWWFETLKKRLVERFIMICWRIKSWSWYFFDKLKLGNLVRDTPQKFRMLQKFFLEIPVKNSDIKSPTRQNPNKPKSRQTKFPTNQNLDKQKFWQTKIPTYQIPDKSKSRQTDFSEFWPVKISSYWDFVWTRFCRNFVCLI